MEKFERYSKISKHFIHLKITERYSKFNIQLINIYIMNDVSCLMLTNSYSYNKLFPFYFHAVSYVVFFIIFITAYLNYFYIFFTIKKKQRWFFYYSMLYWLINHPCRQKFSPQNWIPFFNIYFIYCTTGRYIT